MRPTRGVVEVMGAHHFVLKPIFVELKDLTFTVTLENKQVFYLKLVLFRPPDPEALALVALVLIKKIVDLLVIDL
jgi:hypothetical protein